MAKKKTLLERMEDNPQGDWKMSHVETLCKQTGLHCETPTRGGHHKVFSDHIDDTLTIPARKPIRVFYIKNLTSYAIVHLELVSKKDKES